MTEKKKNGFYLACGIIAVVVAVICGLALMFWVANKVEIMRIYQEMIAEEGQVGMETGLSVQEIFSIVKNYLLCLTIGGAVFAAAYLFNYAMTPEQAKKRWVLMIIVTIASFFFAGIIVGIVSAVGLQRQRELKDSVTITDAPKSDQPENPDMNNNQ